MVVIFVYQAEKNIILEHRRVVVVLTGEIYQILDLSKYIMGKVLDPGREPTMKNLIIDENQAQQVKLVLLVY